MFVALLVWFCVSSVFAADRFGDRTGDEDDVPDNHGRCCLDVMCFSEGHLNHLVLASSAIVGELYENLVSMFDGNGGVKLDDVLHMGIVDAESVLAVSGAYSACHYPPSGARVPFGIVHGKRAVSQLLASFLEVFMYDELYKYANKFSYEDAPKLYLEYHNSTSFRGPNQFTIYTKFSVRYSGAGVKVSKESPEVAVVGSWTEFSYRCTRDSAPAVPKLVYSSWIIDYADCN